MILEPILITDEDIIKIINKYKLRKDNLIKELDFIKGSIELIDGEISKLEQLLENSQNRIDN